MERQRENIMGTMPEGRLLFKLALPMILSVLVSSLYNIVDSIFVSGGAALQIFDLNRRGSAFRPNLRTHWVRNLAVPTR